MKRKCWAIFDGAGFVYTGDVNRGSTGWSSDADDAVLFATEDRAKTHMRSNGGFDGCEAREVQ